MRNILSFIYAATVHLGDGSRSLPLMLVGRFEAVLDVLGVLDLKSDSLTSRGRSCIHSVVPRMRVTVQPDVGSYSGSILALLAPV